MAFGIMVLVLIVLFAFTFAVLGKGEYEPSVEEGRTAPTPTALSA